MNILLIVESPTKEKTFSKYLKDADDTYTVASSKGHVRDLSMKGEGRFGVDIKDGFKPTYKIIKGKEKIIDDLKKLAKKADKVILATDPDREGESIAWHLADELKLDISKTERIEFYEITKPRILEALLKPRKINMDMVYSQEARRILDRIVGFMLSKILNKKVYSPAGGRVQSVALRFVIEREAEVLAFTPQMYFTLETSVDAQGQPLSIEVQSYQGQSLKMTEDKTDLLGHRKIIPLSSEAIAQAYASKLPQAVKLTDVTMASKKKESKAAFRTSTLQQEASSVFRISPKRSQAIAQELYEGVTIGDEVVGLVTYIRTDSDRLSDLFVQEATEYITKQFGPEYVSNKPKAKTAILQSQDAHEAIRPTSLQRTPESMKAYLSPEQFKLYQLIYNRTLASLMTAKQFNVTTYIFEGEGFIFKTQGSVITFPGFSKVYTFNDDEQEAALPQLFKGQMYPLKFESIKPHSTQGPARYSEAKLIQEMEYRGIGRPSTYATTIDRLKQHHYVSVNKNTLWPNPEAHAAMKYLLTYFQYLIDPKYTSDMEGKLDEVKDGETTRVELLQDFYNHFKAQYDQAGELPQDDPVLLFYGRCPKPNCDGVIVPRRSRFGVFLGCSKYPTCDFVTSQVPLPWVKVAPDEGEDQDNQQEGQSKTKVFTGGKRPEPESVGKDCPLCGKPLVKRFTKRGSRPFIGCSGYPTCKHLENIPKEDKPADESEPS